jgi:hypothetical protein
MSVLVVGAGLAGLYAALLLTYRRRQVIVFGTLGGKVRTFRKTPSPLELGPSIFHTGQQHMCKLIQVCQLTPRLIAGPPSPLDKVKALPGRTVAEVLPLSRPDMFEIEDMGYEAWFQSNRLVRRICAIEEGWDTLVTRLVALLKKRGVQFVPHLARKVTVDETGVTVSTDRGAHTGTEAILAISLEHVASLHLDVPSFSHAYVATLHPTRTVPSIRIYVELTSPVPDHVLRDPLFDVHSSFVWCIKVSSTVLLLCYTDGDMAQARANPAQAFVDECIKQVSDAVHHPLHYKRIISKFWPDAITIHHGHGQVKEELYETGHIICPRLYQTYVPNRLHQAWVESHLMQSARCVDSITL